MEGPQALSLGGPFGCGAAGLWAVDIPLRAGLLAPAQADDNHEARRQGNKKKNFMGSIWMSKPDPPRRNNMKINI
ncbi:hypothetical protein PSEEN2715 [Pseudomonas entomophila L48]|uniref:Uncharacterized protein n=1 Tax=Pseudomonas entomophila (strain L48) TaxID=384676 RepID=Q1IA19_PSEE4|nr:hypothetical protein PSEEN2715 [Pseudomonas entomophila L48]